MVINAQTAFLEHAGTARDCVGDGRDWNDADAVEFMTRVAEARPDLLRRMEEEEGAKKDRVDD